MTDERPSIEIDAPSRAVLIYYPPSSVLPLPRPNSIISGVMRVIIVMRVSSRWDHPPGYSHSVIYVLPPVCPIRCTLRADRECVSNPVITERTESWRLGYIPHQNYGRRRMIARLCDSCYFRSLSPVSTPLPRRSSFCKKHQPPTRPISPTPFFISPRLVIPRNQQKE